MLLDPFEDLDLILETAVYAAVFANLRTAQKAIRTNPIIEGDDDYVHIRGVKQACRIVIGVSIYIVPATLDKDVYR